MDFIAHSRVYAMADTQLEPVETACSTATTSPAPILSRMQPTYGYHNSYRTHALPMLTKPPSYDHATTLSANAWHRQKTLAETTQIASQPNPPPYSCTVQAEGLVSIKYELTSVFQGARNERWMSVWAELCGTQLRLHRLKSSILAKSSGPSPGRLLKTFTLQHAEVGIAADFKDDFPAPKSPLVRLVPFAARQKLQETEPYLFEPIREHALRLRLETEQFLFCAESEQEMISWAEKLCAAVDISPPLEDRSEPRYRSLPRRNRRQRMLDGTRLMDRMEDLSSLDVGRRIIAAQEDIIRQLYPHLSADAAVGACEAIASQESSHTEREDWLDPEDLRLLRAENTYPFELAGPTTADQVREKHPPICDDDSAQSLRYRRRCAPVLLACSPRVSEVVYSNGQRVRINLKAQTLESFNDHAPRYDSHHFPGTKRFKRTKIVATQPLSDMDTSLRPLAPTRTVSNISFASSSSEGVADRQSREYNPDEIRPDTPSPTELVHAKSDAPALSESMGKRGSDAEDLSSPGFVRVVALDVGVLG